MQKIKEVDKVIVSRKMEFVHADGKREKAFIKVGKPYELNKKLDWMCPYKIGTESQSKTFGMVGLDSLQALELTMKTLDTEIECWEKTNKGKFALLN
ncbi:DUF6968 family protein [Agarilytica rhodophyticola]|uniref:DUF6968 family protein n=1 Tax=Agarilytica rhodophyticola TaxID=1737490 RepID=UPI000B349E14|nr:hypothetical protein [Agarilytica rhodophyticola]